MKVSENHIAVWLIKAIFAIPNDDGFKKEKYLPKTLCGLFWMALLSLLLQIAMWPFLFALPFKKDLRKDPGYYNEQGVFNSGFLMVLWYFFSFITAFHFDWIFFGEDPTLFRLILGLILGLVAVPIGLGIIFGGVFLVIYPFTQLYSWGTEKLKERRMRKGNKKNIPNEKERTSVTKEYFKAVKNKVCPRLKYVMDEDYDEA